MSKANCMLGSKLDNKFNESRSVTLMQKYDGVRCITVKQGDYIYFMSRQGKEIEHMYEIKRDISNLPDGVYDGELVASIDGSNHATKITSLKGDKRGLKYIIFDIVIMNMTFKDRRNMLTDIMDSHIKDVKDSTITQTSYVVIDQCLSKDEIETLSNMYCKEYGWEGLMTAYEDGYYTCSRSKELFKVKQQFTMDLKVVNVKISNTGKYTGLIGALIVEYKGNKVSVGSGLSDFERRQNPEFFIGKIIEVGYHAITDNDKGTQSLRFPTLKRIRFDKDEESYH